MPDSATSPDVRQLAGEALPRDEFPASRQADFRVFFDPLAHAGIWRHAGEDTTVEICGVLVGRCAQDGDGPFAVVTDTIRCDEATSKFAEVTFTHESWSKINSAMDTKFQDKRIIGWYHTHPDFGIFLSERDTFIHQNFFSGPGQVALVVDPVRRIEGVFTWRDGKPAPAPHYWVGNRVQLDGAVDRPERGTTASPAASMPPPAGRTAAYPDESLGTILRAALPIVLAFLVGYLISGLLTGWRSDSERQQMFREMLTSYQYSKVLRPALSEQLAEISVNLRLLGETLRDLANDHVQRAGDDAKQVRGDWSAISDLFDKTRRLADYVRNTYGLTPDETALLNQIVERQSAAGMPASSDKDRPEDTKSSEESRARADGKPADNKPAETGSSSQSSGPDASGGQN